MHTSIKIYTSCCTHTCPLKFVPHIACTHVHKNLYLTLHTHMSIKIYASHCTHTHVHKNVHTHLLKDKKIPMYTQALALFSFYSINHPVWPLNVFLSCRLNIKSNCGLRIIELRNDSDGMVFHHWEFLSESPPTQFTLKRSRLKHVPENCTVVVVLAEDSYGNIMKKRISLDNIQWGDGSPGASGCAGLGHEWISMCVFFMFIQWCHA